MTNLDSTEIAILRNIAYGMRYPVVSIDNNGITFNSADGMTTVNPLRNPGHALSLLVNVFTDSLSDAEIWLGDRQFGISVEDDTSVCSTDVYPAMRIERVCRTICEAVQNHLLKHTC